MRNVFVSVNKCIYQVVVLGMADILTYLRWLNVSTALGHNTHIDGVGPALGRQCVLQVNPPHFHTPNNVGGF